MPRLTCGLTTDRKPDLLKYYVRQSDNGGEPVTGTIVTGKEGKKLNAGIRLQGFGRRKN